MSAHPVLSAELLCDRCGYDLRVQPQEGKCPECGASVAESRRWAGVPRRPAWRDSDPRWRRRVLAGVWVLVLVPLVDALTMLGWASSVPVPSVIGYGAVRTLDETLLHNLNLYPSIVFCMGMVLLFSKERGRRRGQLDWTRRWGVLCSYVVLLLSAVQILFICALVLAGIAAVFMSMPLKNQPPVTRVCVEASAAYLRHGAYPKEMSIVVLVSFSSVVILLACVPLFNALRSSGPKWLAQTLLAPLALFSLMSLVQVGRYFLGASSVNALYSYAVYFRPTVLAAPLAGIQTYLNSPGSDPGAFIMEAAKWGIVLTIAMWLSIARVAARIRNVATRSSGPLPP